MSLPLPFFKTKFEDKHIVDQKFYMAKHNEENRDILLFANEVHERPNNNNGPAKTTAVPSLVSTPPPRGSSVAGMEKGGKNKKGGKEKVLSKEEEQRLLFESATYRLSGNRLFNTSYYLAALDAYLLALSRCPQTLKLERATIYHNIAATQIKLRSYDEAVKAASRALNLRPGWGKALYRRAKAREGMGGWAGLVGAYDDYVQVLEGAVDGAVEGVGKGELEAVKEKIRWLPDRIKTVREKEVEGVVGVMEGLKT
ncbi:unnamed protein product [Tuber melanosporum]|uniref:(Perigord truffle) hypothetical protein n=1 Tax=Tuber melanosporum (strain Mel28) TaxID=656061 RepID=D5GEU4_TUBMM|nr:uncharacterized protein GSTUM_00001397001 [Tuber melanosporum]CAZ83037.1 unnamed protein product [Tuber melanosporum]